MTIECQLQAKFKLQAILENKRVFDRKQLQFN